MIIKKINIYLFIGVMALQMPFILKSQSLKIGVKNNFKKPLYAATVQIMNVSDSTSYNTVTSEAGVAHFENVKNGLYRIKISFVGFSPIEKSVAIKSDRRYLEYILSEQKIALNEVTVTARKPMITQEDDKMIIDPEPIANTSTNTLEMLENTPGMYVDQDGGIFLNSASAATIYINGREQKMSNQDITTLLRSLPPGSVQRIEVMRTPSTKYDASSSGGIINIILKKGVKIGRFSSLNLGMNQGKYGNKFLGFSTNNSGSKSTSYINLNINYSDQEEVLNATRLLRMDTALIQHSTTRNSGYQGYLGYGINYDINKQWNFNYDGRLNINAPTTASTVINSVENGIENILMNSENQFKNNNLFYNLQQDIGLNFKIDTIGSNWDSKISFNYNNTSTNQDYKITYQKPISIILNGDGTNRQHRNFVLFQSDLTVQFPKKFKVELGEKSTFQWYVSNADYYSISGTQRVNDLNKTNAFDYQENINAGYLQASKTVFWDVLLKAGVRMEHTYMNGNQIIPSDTNFQINRVDWFPYVYISRPLFKIADFELRAFAIYRKTINRPDYQSLNPYKKYLDEFQFETGNPNLQPQFSDNIEFNVSFDDTPLFAIGRNFTTDIFANVTYKDPTNENIAVKTFDNIGKSTETYFRAIAGIPPGKRYFFAIGGQYNLNEYDGLYENKPLKYSRGSWRFFSFHSLKLFAETKLTVSGFMMINGLFNFYELEPFGQLNIGLNQTFFQKKMNITLSMRDILHTMKTVFSMQQGTIFSNGDRYSDNQRFSVQIRYNFGIQKKEDKKGMFNGELEE